MTERTMMCGDRWLTTGSPWEGDEMTDKIRAALVDYRALAVTRLAIRDADEALREYDARATPALPQGVEEWMPILGTCLAIPMKLLDESQAKSNHGQTPARLKERGGISLSEAVAIAGKMKWRSLESKRALEILHDLSGMAIVPVVNIKSIVRDFEHHGRETPIRVEPFVRVNFAHEDWDARDTFHAMLAAAKEKGE